MIKLLKLAFLIFLVWALYNFQPQIFKAIGGLLVTEDKLLKADAIVVMNGDDKDGSRMRKAIDLFRKGYGKYIVFCGKKIGWETYSTDIMRNQAYASKVPETSIISAITKSDSTIDEVNTLLRVFKEKDFRDVLVVTSNYHTRRTAFVFRHLVNSDGVKISMVPAQNSEFRTDSWWQNRLYAKTFFFEASKLLWYYTAENFSHNFRNNSSVKTEESAGQLPIPQAR